MNRSVAVAEGLRAFYDAFNSGDAASFEAVIADGDGVSVIGSAPGEGHGSRAEWLKTYEDVIGEAGLKLESGGRIDGYEGGGTGSPSTSRASCSPAAVGCARA
jgi:hypothetical protein